jgi:acyl-CoA-binding protein
MSDLKIEFEQATQDAKQLAQAPDGQTLLKLYALYKQANLGDVTGQRPGMTDFVGRAKYDAWAKLKGVGADDAMQQYITLVESLKTA